MINAELKCLPQGWRATTIGDAANIFSGATPSTEVASYWNGAIPWCIPTDITGWKGKYLVATERSITEQGLVSSGASMLPAGSLLLCSRATIGDVKIAAMPICTNQGFKSLVCRDDVFNEFLYYLIHPLKPRLAELATGSTFRELSKHDLANIAIMLPPLSEQRAIAAVLSDIDSLIDAIDALIAKKQAVKKATMQRLLTGQTRLPGFSGEWKTKRLGELGTFAKGYGIRRSDLSDNGLPCVLYGELYTRYGESIVNPVSKVPQEVAQTALPIEAGELLFAGSGETIEDIGRCAAYLGTSTAYAGGDIIVLTPTEGNSLYLGHLMNHPSVSAQKARMGHGATIAHINTRNLAQIQIDIPEDSEQCAIAEILTDMDAEIEALERRRDKTEAIKQGMMQELLTGKTRLPEAKE